MTVAWYFPPIRVGPHGVTPKTLAALGIAFVHAPSAAPSEDRKVDGGESVRAPTQSITKVIVPRNSLDAADRLKPAHYLTVTSCVLPS